MFSLLYQLTRASWGKAVRLPGCCSLSFLQSCMFLVLCIPFLRCYYVGKTESIRTLINIWVIITVCISLPLLYRQTATEDRVKGFSTYDHFPSHSCTADFCISHSHSGRCARTMMCYEVALTAAGHCINSTCTPHNGDRDPTLLTRWKHLRGEGLTEGAAGHDASLSLIPSSFAGLWGKFQGAEKSWFSASILRASRMS